MPRYVKFHKKEPLPIEVNDKKIWICMCGLSDKFPYCSGRHKYAKDEEENQVYMYDENYNRKKVKDIIFEKE
ncbi:MAG: CDGSH iron-sulfur domain-containing protein [Candidatus Calescibacterium sp.]|nr:CDGSH iron-sulfur domain-containing protein [Candidatus Calescibacterium sp.]MCX7971684.1 CDGSH iron-sulfur domain-containing protein [bacterium]MDW8195290.1 CDGSH iron-sulfur domain-containing protein [Candidatus Calescibacterium sp.]